MAPLSSACDRYIQKHLELLQPEFAIGVGAFAEACLARIAKKAGLAPEIGRILHPSPASPAANRDWAGTATKQLKEIGIWK